MSTRGAVQAARRWFLRLASAIGILYLIVTLTPLTFWWATFLAGPWNDPPGDVLIVLTGASLEDGTIGLNSYWRAAYAARIFKAEPFAEMIISGGGPDVPAAVPMRDFVVSHGVAADRVRLDTDSTSTRGSAEWIAAMLKREPERYRGRRLVLLSSDYHMRRAGAVFRKAGVNIAPRPIPDARKRYSQPLDRWGVFFDLALESTKLVYYWARGWL